MRTSKFNLGKKYYYTVTVEYLDPFTNEILQYETPNLSFDVYHCLGSKKCSVYILYSRIYVSDFVALGKNEKIIWSLDDEQYKEIAKANKKERVMIVSRFALFILFFVVSAIISFIIET